MSEYPKRDKRERIALVVRLRYVRELYPKDRDIRLDVTERLREMAGAEVEGIDTLLRSVRADRIATLPPRQAKAIGGRTIPMQVKLARGGMVYEVLESEIRAIDNAASVEIPAALLFGVMVGVVISLAILPLQSDGLIRWVSACIFAVLGLLMAGGAIKARRLRRKAVQEILGVEPRA